MAACLLSGGVGLAEGCRSAAMSVALPITAASRAASGYGLSGVLQPSHLVCMCLQAATACWRFACPSLSNASCCSGLCLHLWCCIWKIVAIVFFCTGSLRSFYLRWGQCFASIAVHRGTTTAERSCIPLAAVGGPAKFFVGTVVQCGIPVSGLSSQAGHICCRTTTVQLSLRCEWLVRACYGLGVVTGLVVSLCTVEAFLL